MNDVVRLSDIAGKPAGLGLPFVRMVKAMVLSKNDPMSAVVIAEKRWPRETNVIECLKSAVNFGSLTGSTWGSQTAAYRTLAEGFISALRTASVAQRLNARRVPFLSHIPRV